MKKLFIAWLLVLFSVTVSFGQSKCFSAGGLKDRTIVRFSVEGNKVSGEFIIERDYDSSTTDTYSFTGTLKGNTLTVKFANGKLPDVSPSEMKSLVWTLVQSGDNEILRIKYYGKNYNTNKYSNYFAEFDSCEPSYASLAKSAQKVSFAKGASSATVSVSFKNKDERKSFRLGLAKGQMLSVEAIGCGISFYYPNKTQYEEGTAIDMLGVDLSQSGNYLFIIQPAGEPSTCSVTFKAANK